MAVLRMAQKARNSGGKLGTVDVQLVQVVHRWRPDVDGIIGNVRLRVVLGYDFLSEPVDDFDVGG